MSSDYQQHVLQQQMMGQQHVLNQQRMLNHQHHQQEQILAQQQHQRQILAQQHQQQQMNLLLAAQMNQQDGVIACTQATKTKFYRRTSPRIDERASERLSERTSELSISAIPGSHNARVQKLLASTASRSPKVDNRIAASDGFTRVSSRKSDNSDKVVEAKKDDRKSMDDDYMKVNKEKSYMQMKKAMRTFTNRSPDLAGDPNLGSESSNALHTTGILPGSLPRKKTSAVGDWGLTEQEISTFGDRWCFPELEKLKLLGRGGCAVVWLGAAKPQTEDDVEDLTYAVKQIAKSSDNGPGGGAGGMSKGQLDALRTEYIILDHIGKHFKDCRHIAGVVAFHETSKDIWIAQENGGAPISKRIFDVKGEFLNSERIYQVRHGDMMLAMKKDVNILRKILHQLLKALNYLFKLQIVHADIKPDNILFDDMNIRLCDFGSAYIQTENSNEEVYQLVNGDVGRRSSSASENGYPATGSNAAPRSSTGSNSNSRSSSKSSIVAPPRQLSGMRQGAGLGTPEYMSPEALEKQINFTSANSPKDSNRRETLNSTVKQLRKTVGALGSLPGSKKSITSISGSSRGSVLSNRMSRGFYGIGVNEPPKRKTIAGVTSSSSSSIASAMAPSYSTNDIVVDGITSHGGGHSQSNDVATFSSIGNDEPARHPTSALDMWAVGMVILELCHGVPLWLTYKCRVVDENNPKPMARVPISGKNIPGIVPSGLLAVPQRDYRKIRVKQDAVLDRLLDILTKKSHGVKLLKDNSEETDQCLDLFQCFLHKSPYERITPIQALRHPWFTNYR